MGGGEYPCSAWSYVLVALCREVLAPTKGAQGHDYFLLLVLAILNFLTDLEASGSIVRKSFPNEVPKSKSTFMFQKILLHYPGNCPEYIGGHGTVVACRKNVHTHACVSALRQRRAGRDVRGGFLV